MKFDFQMLCKLRDSEAYKKLMALWLETITDIESRRDVAASRGQESAWRYYAGQEKGFKRAMMLLDEKISQLEADGGDPSDQPSEQIERLLDEARGNIT
jgi:hypothetical protein